jgi:hypothetical protein
MGRERRGVARGNQGVGVGRVADDENTHITGGVPIECASLVGKDLRVHAEKILAFHAGGTRAGADEERQVGVAERYLRPIAGHDIVEERERSVLQLHDDARESLGRLGDFEKLQDNGLIRSEEISRRETEDEGVADVAGGASDGDADGFGHGVILVGLVKF